MEHYKKLLLGVIATLSLVATVSATPVFASDKGGMTVTHKDFTTSISTNATVAKDTTKSTQATQAVTTKATQASLSYGWNILNGDYTQICFTKGNVKVHGWLNDGGWRYFDQSTGNMMVNKWLKDGGVWYYLGHQGRMYSNMYVPNIGSFDASGKWLGYEKVNPKASDSPITSVDSSSTNESSKTITITEFNTKLAKGQIKARITHGSTGGSTGTDSGCLVWYLV